MPHILISLLKTNNQCITSIHQWIGRCLGSLTAVMAILVAIIIVARMFNMGSTALQESVTYIHATIFMLCLGFAGTNHAHVRVDICYRKYSALTKSWVNLFGSILFLLPFSIFLTAISFDSAMHSWQMQESSINAGGLPFVFLLKSLPPAGGALLCLYALSDISMQLLNISVLGVNSDDS